MKKIKVKSHLRKTKKGDISFIKSYYRDFNKDKKNIIKKDSKDNFSKNENKNIKFTNLKEEDRLNILNKIIEKSNLERKNNYKHNLDYNDNQSVFYGTLNKKDLINKINDHFKNDPELNKMFRIVRHPEKNEYGLISYSSITSQLYDLYKSNPELIELRGIMVKFNNNNEIEDIITRPYPKFFNVNEFDEIKIDKLPQEKSDKIEILEKYDGSLMIGYKLGDEISLSTKGSFGGKQRDSAVNFLNTSEKGENIKKFINDIQKLGYTPMFEYIDKDMPLTVKYDKSNLILTGIRNNENGSYIPYDHMENIAKLYEIDYAKRYEFKNFEELSKFINSQENFEGVVARFTNKDGSLYVKIKSDQYFQHYKILNSLGGSLGESKTTPIHAMDAIISGEMDDIISKLPSDIKEKVNKIKEKLYEKLNELYNNRFKSKKIKNLSQKLNLDLNNLDFDEFIKNVYPHVRSDISQKIKKEL